MARVKLSSCKKVYCVDTHRTRSPEDTLEIISPLAKECGITRITDITGLDRLGIPVFSCIRPGAEEGANSVYNGKGATETAAKVSAIMEGIERYSAELNERETVTERFSQLGESVALNPEDLILPKGIHPDSPLPWCDAYDIANDEEKLLPAHSVYHPIPHGTVRFIRTSTNGIASGNTIEEATFHALSEVIERDAWSLVEACGDAGPVIEGIDSPVLTKMIAAFEDNGVDIILRDITSDIGIPTIAAVADDVKLKDPSLLVTGMGTHVSPVIAAIRAITEVAQSRATQIHSSGEDATGAPFRMNIGYDRTKRFNKKWFADGEKRDFSEIKGFVSDDFLKDIQFTTKLLENSGLDRVFVSDLTMPDVKIPVVRVVVPGLETYVMDSERYGKRCDNARRNRVLRAKSVQR